MLKMLPADRHGRPFFEMQYIMKQCLNARTIQMIYTSVSSGLGLCMIAILAGKRIKSPFLTHILVQLSSFFPKPLQSGFKGKTFQPRSFELRSAFFGPISSWPSWWLIGLTSVGSRWQSESVSKGFLKSKLPCTRPLTSKVNLK